jgi:hypothetical protein
MPAQDEAGQEEGEAGGRERARDGVAAHAAQEGRHRRRGGHLILDTRDARDARDAWNTGSAPNTRRTRDGCRRGGGHAERERQGVAWRGGGSRDGGRSHACAGDAHAGHLLGRRRRYDCGAALAGGHGRRGRGSIAKGEGERRAETDEGHDEADQPGPQLRKRPAAHDRAPGKTEKQEVCRAAAATIGRL